MHLLAQIKDSSAGGRSALPTTNTPPGARDEARPRQMDVAATDFPDAAFDYAVATFLFCVLEERDHLAALRELGRILKPGGEIRCLDYVNSRHPVRRLVMGLWAPWVRLMYGASFERDVSRHVAAAGLEIVEARFVVADIIRMLRLRRK